MYKIESVGGTIMNICLSIVPTLVIRICSVQE